MEDGCSFSVPHFEWNVSLMTLDYASIIWSLPILHIVVFVLMTKEAARLERKEWTHTSYRPGLNPGSVTSWLCDLGQI